MALRCGLLASAAFHWTMPHVRSAYHADLAVAPRLARDPVQCVVAVVNFLGERLERALALIAPAYVLHDDGVSMVHEGLVSSV